MARSCRGAKGEKGGGCWVIHNMYDVYVSGRVKVSSIPGGALTYSTPGGVYTIGRIRDCGVCFEVVWGLGHDIKYYAPLCVTWDKGALLDAGTHVNDLHVC